jgi:mRNA-degrading endonuclease RelE of RelBE toxin-antitoxin system
MSEIGCKAALTKSFLKELKKLLKTLRVLKAIDEVVANPYAGIKLKGELEGVLEVEDRRVQNHLLDR